MAVRFFGSSSTDTFEQRLHHTSEGGASSGGALTVTAEYLRRMRPLQGATVRMACTSIDSANRPTSNVVFTP